MFLVLQIASGILLAIGIYKGIPWVVRKLNERAAEDKWLREIGTAARLDREGDGDWIRSTPPKNDKSED